MVELPEGIDSVFRYIVICAQRAEQLIRGARPRLESKHVKPTLVAKDEVDAGLVPWREVSQAELEAERRALLEEIRAEMESAEAAAPEPEPEEESRDAELERLQRLFGMALKQHRDLLEDLEEEEPERVSLDEAAAEEEPGEEPEEE